MSRWNTARHIKKFKSRSLNHCYGACLGETQLIKSKRSKVTSLNHCYGTRLGKTQLITSKVKSLNHCYGTCLRKTAHHVKRIKSKKSKSLLRHIKRIKSKESESLLWHMSVQNTVQHYHMWECELHLWYTSCWRRFGN